MSDSYYLYDLLHSRSYVLGLPGAVFVLIVALVVYAISSAVHVFRPREWINPNMTNPKERRIYNTA